MFRLKSFCFMCNQNNGAFCLLHSRTRPGSREAIAPQVSKIWAKLQFFGQQQGIIWENNFLCIESEQ